MNEQQINTLELLDELAEASQSITINSGEIHPKVPRTFTKKEATDYLKCDPRTLARYAAELEIDTAKYREHGIDFLMTIEEIYAVRDKLPSTSILKKKHEQFVRSAHQKCQRLVIQNQKGGVSKTVTAITLGTGLAIELHQQYRVCLVDMDGQSTLTMYQPPAEGEERTTTVGDLMCMDPDSEGFANTVKGAVYDTTVPNMKILPADQADRELEAEFHKGLFEGTITSPYTRLSRILEVIEDDFDVIIIDTPPSFGFAALNSYHAATSIIFPLSTSQNDVDATCQYLTYLPRVYKTLLNSGHNGYDFIRMLVTNFEESTSSLEMLDTLSTHFDPFLYKTCFKKSEAVRKTSLEKNSVFDLSKSTFDGTKSTLQAAKINARAVVDEVHRDLKNVWNKQ
jgi:ATPases involved in chromosome partitioning